MQVVERGRKEIVRFGDNARPSPPPTAPTPLPPPNGGLLLVTVWSVIHCCVCCLVYSDHPSDVEQGFVPEADSPLHAGDYKAVYGKSRRNKHVGNQRPCPGEGSRNC